MLLGRPWIHAAHAVPSTYHQAVKYIENGMIVTVRGETEILLTKPVSMPYVDNADAIEEDIGHGLEVVDASMVDSGAPTGDASSVAIRMMKMNGYQEGKGLGRELQGMKEPVGVVQKKDLFGLGYDPAFEEKMMGWRICDDQRPIPHLKEIFPAPAKTIGADPQLHLRINAIEEDEGGSKTVQACKEPLQNWKAEPVHDVISKK